MRECLQSAMHCAICQCIVHKAMQQATATLVVRFAAPDAGLMVAPNAAAAASSSKQGVALYAQAVTARQQKE